MTNHVSAMLGAWQAERDGAEWGLGTVAPTGGPA